MKILLENLYEFNSSRFDAHLNFIFVTLCRKYKLITIEHIVNETEFS